MTDILGHDVNGRPLRAGDECRVIKAFHGEHSGLICTVIGKAPENELGHFIVDVWNSFSDSWATAFSGQLSKLDNQQPAGSFDEVMAGLKQTQLTGENS